MGQTDLSKGTFANTSQQMEMKEVYFTIEVNWLQGR
jgi:hypothetical protein